MATIRCKTNTEQGEKTLSSEPDKVTISDPRLIDFRTEEPNLKKALERVIKYITEKEGEIQNFYLDSLYMKEDTVILQINHVDYYSVLAQAEKERKRIEELEKEDNNEEFIEILFLPPTGNWSGKDRTLLYLIEKDSLIDILYQ